VVGIFRQHGKFYPPYGERKRNRGLSGLNRFLSKEGMKMRRLTFGTNINSVIIVSITLVIILAMTVMSLNTLEVITEQRDIKVLPNDYNPYQKLYDDLLAPTVRIENASGIGSGVIISATGATDWILTAAHVVGNNSSVVVTFYSYISNTQTVLCDLCAFVVMTDTGKDLALLRTQINADLKDIIHKAKLASKDYTPFLFAPIYAVGCSLGLDPRPSSGIITAISDNQRSSASYWEISAPILPGNSGGPVFDANTHEVIGIAVWVKVYHGQLVTTMAGVIPITEIYKFLNSHRDLENIENK
jgi:S1-C subfamily serine protease